jgi:hypothetical protein
MEPEPDGPYSGSDDEVSRQREKRNTAFLARLVPGFPGLTFGQTVARVVLAGEQAADVLDVERFLADQGHDWRTIESVLAYLGLDAAMYGTGTVVEFPVRRRPCGRDVDGTGCEHADRAGAAPAHAAPHGTRSEPAAVTTNDAAGDDLARLPSVVVDAPATHALNSARRLQVLERLQAMLLRE